MANNNSTYKPINEGSTSLVIKTNGKEIDCYAFINSVTVYEEFNQIAKAEIVFSDGGTDDDSFEIGNSDTFAFGKEIEILCNYEDKNPATIFNGVIVKNTMRLTGNASELVISAKHKAFHMTQIRHTCCFSDMSDSDAMNDIIQRYGIEADVEDTTATHESIMQYNATDWDFINMRAEANGKLLCTSPDGIKIASPNVNESPVIQIDNGFNIQEFEADICGETQFSKYETHAWQPTEQEETEFSADGSKHDVEQGDLASSEIADMMKNDDYVANVMSSQNNDDTISAYTESVAMHKTMSRIKGKATFAGHAPIHPGDIVTFDRLGKRFNGATIVSSVVHDIESDWTTTIQFGLDDMPYAEKFDNIVEQPASGLLPGVNGLQIAKVTQLSGDPLGEDRIQVKMVYGSESLLWARIAVLDAGNERGTFFMPEVDDEVVLGFIDDNPNNAVILGMLHSSQAPVPTEITDDNFTKGIYTREKLKLEFDEDKKSVKIETPAGNLLSLSEDEKAISIKDQNGNKIILNEDGIAIESAKSLTLKAAQDIKIEGNNVSVDAKMNAAFTGKTEAKVESSAKAVLKGGIVQIN